MDTITEKKDLDTEETSVETVADSETEITAPETQLSKLQSIAKERFPDQEFDGDDAIVDALMASNSELEGKYSKSQDVTKKLVEIFEAYPEFRACVGDIIMGAKPRAAIAKYYSQEDLTPQEGDEDHEAWAANVKERETSRANDEKFRSDLNANHEFSEKEWEEFKTDCGLNESQAQEFVDWCNNMLNEIYSGKISKVALEALKKGWKHDEDVAEGIQMGEIKGKNAQIKVKKEKVEKGDGMPSLTASTDAKQTPIKEKSYIGQIGDRIADRKIL